MRVPFKNILQYDPLQLNELFTDTKQELDEKTEELTVTTKNLEETADTLKVTRGVLRKTRRDRDEQKHLVGEHVKSESSLQEQASEVYLTFLF